MAELLVRAFPLLAGKEAELRQFAEAVSTTRAGEVADFHRRMGIARESWHMQQTPFGTWVIGVTEMSQRPLQAAAQEYAASQHGFDRWFKEQVKTISGIDPETTPLGPPTECIFDSLNVPDAARSSGSHIKRDSGASSN
jgi:hypothetical protein